jgi:hypothetical protein
MGRQLRDSTAWAMPGIAALALTGIVVLAGCGQAAGSGYRDDGPAPNLYWFTPSAATAGARTAEAAWHAGIQYDLCNPVTAKSITETWLVNGPTYGVVWVDADCTNDPQNPGMASLLAEVHVDAVDYPGCRQWASQGGALWARRHPFPAKDGWPVPTWLPLPSDAYSQLAIGSGQHPFSSGSGWESATRMYFAERYEGVAARPASATDLQLASHRGWQVVQHGIATDVFSLPDGWTFFFSGTDSPAAIDQDAIVTLAHLDSFLAKPLDAQGTPPASYYTPTAAC